MKLKVVVRKGEEAFVKIFIRNFIEHMIDNVIIIDVNILDYQLLLNHRMSMMNINPVMTKGG